MTDDSTNYTRSGPKPRRAKWQQPPIEFIYRDEHGQPVFRVCRQVAAYGTNRPALDESTGKQLKRCFEKWPTPDGKRPNNAPVLLPLYCLPELIAAVTAGRVVYVVEGEPKVEALRRWGLTATCNAEGAGKWKRQHAEFLRGADVVILPDNDDPGRKHADLVGRSLETTAARRRLLELPGLPEHGDIVDWIKAGNSKEKFAQLVAAAPDWKPYRPKPADNDAPAAPTPDFQFELLSGAGLTPKQQQWLWLGRIPRGTLSLLIGLPDVGKSHIFIDICARMTTGRTMPPDPDVLMAAPQSVLIVCTEDRVEHTLVPRLMAAGADLNRVTFLRYLRTSNGTRRGLDLTQDVQRIEGCLNQYPDITFIVFDPISEFLGAKIDSHSNTAVRAVLGQLMELLDKCNIAALGISHLPKVKTGAVQTASIGSIGFSACARSSLLIIDEEEEIVDEHGDSTGEWAPTGRKLLTVNKRNLAPPEDRQTLAFKLVPATLNAPHDDITVARVQWDGIKKVTAREIWQDNKSKKPSQKDEAIRFIKQAMRDPEQPDKYRRRLAAEIEAEAIKAEISLRTLKRAKKELGVRSEQEEGNSTIWWWVVPPHWDGPKF